MATGEGVPLRQGAGMGLDWFSVATEASGGGTPDLGYFLEVSVFIGIFGVGLMSRRFPSRPRGRPTRPGGHPPSSWMAQTLLAQLFYSRGFFWSIKNHQKLARHLDSIWYSFSVELKNKEKTKTGTGL